MSSESSNLELVRRYLAAIEHGAEGELLAAFFTPDVVFEEKPNRLAPNGSQQDLSAMQAAAARGKRVIAAQRYEIQNALASGDQVALEVVWSGILAIPFGTLPAGGSLRAHFAIFLEFRDGRIARQRNYDCFEPW
ncbi:MAG: nuclear transport factor 2 family protein [Chloroflexi bacterium]|nr:nuclear transport factor 2 family protein [Chloroflexota bacterium]